jgi:DNA-binding beta-propeller fold protein YncE
MRRSRLVVLRLEDRTTPSTLISVGGAQDLAFDAARNRLYVTTTNGSVVPYDVAGNTLLPAVAVGTSLNGEDITPDNHYLYVAENQPGPTQGYFYKIDLTDPNFSSTLVPYNLGFYEGGAYDIAIGPSGTALVTTRFQGSGWVDSKLLDTTTDTFTLAGRSVNQDTHLDRSADRSLVFLAESNNSGGPIETYRFGTGFSAQKDYNWYLDSTRSAVNRDGSLIASEVSVTSISNNLSVVDANLNAVQVLSGYDGGMAFDPTKNVLYAVNSTTDMLAAIDTNTWRVLYQMPVGQDVGQSNGLGAGVMAVSSDGSKVFLITSTGIRRFDLPAATGVAATLQFSNVSTFRAAGVPTTVTVTALDPAGNVVTNYAGTVSFGSTDPTAGLPALYTFNPAEGGVHTFALTWNTAGSRTLTVTQTVPTTLTATTPAVTVTSGAVSLIPVTARRDLVYDDTHGLLLITTSNGTVERYDPVQKSLLAPLTGGASYNGADITPDGSALYVADGQRSLIQSIVRKIDPLTGATTLLRHAGPDGGAWDVEVAANGTGIVDYRFEGSGWVNLDRIDVANNTLTSAGRSVRQNSNLYRGAGRNLMFGTESNISSGPMWTYDPATNTFPSSANTNAFLDNDLAAVNRTGTLIALEFGSGATVMNPSFGTVRVLSGIDGGLAFDPARDVLYGVNSTTDQIIAYDTNTWAVKYSLPVGENVPTASALNNGVMAASGDGKYLFLSTPSAVRVYSIAPSLTVSAASSVITGQPLTVTVTAKTPTGAVDTTYRGSVSWTSTDGLAGLPSAYPFSAADAGTHSFSVTLNTVGNQSITAADNQVSLPATAPVNVLPAQVQGFQVNDGNAQRSRVVSLTVNFNTVVAFADPNNIAAAFQLSRDGGGFVGGFTASAATVGGKTAVTLTNFTGAETSFGSLVDGVYTLRVLAAQVGAGGVQLDGDANGVGGGDYLVDGTKANGLFRLFGDADGNGVVDATDVGQLKSTFNYNSTQGQYLWYFDADGDGVVDATDVGQFKSRWNTTLFT